MSPEPPQVEFGFAVDDAERVAVFYEQVLGCRREREATLPPSLTRQLGLGEGGQLVWLSTPEGSVLKLLGDQGGTPSLVRPSNAGIARGAFVTFYIEDLAAVLRAVADAGGRSIGPVVEVPNGARVCFVSDPAGSLVELVEPSQSASSMGR